MEMNIHGILIVHSSPKDMSVILQETSDLSHRQTDRQTDCTPGKKQNTDDQTQAFIHDMQGIKSELKSHFWLVSGVD